MNLNDIIFDPATPVRFFELVPPAADRPEAIEASLEGLREVRGLAEAINLPEIHEESRGSPRTAQYVERVEPRQIGARIRRDWNLEVTVNRGVVYEADQLTWFRRTHEEFDISNFVLVGGESEAIAYPGPSVLDAARQVREAGLPLSLGGISIPSRLHEDERIRSKTAAGLTFFTTQVLFDSNDVVWLIQKLNGLEARVFLSFAPVSHPRDLKFLRWLGADIPADLDRYLLRGEVTRVPKVRGAPPGEPAPVGDDYLNRSMDLARRILMDVFDNLPPDPPPIGLNVEHINQRNFGPAVKMLRDLGNLYTSLVASRARQSAGTRV
jgi:hypothetical protein